MCKQLEAVSLVQSSCIRQAGSWGMAFDGLEYYVVLIAVVVHQNDSFVAWTLTYRLWPNPVYQVGTHKPYPDTVAVPVFGLANQADRSHSIHYTFKLHKSNP